MFTCFLTDARTEIHSLNSAGITVAERQSESVGGESEKFQSDISWNICLNSINVRLSAHDSHQALISISARFIELTI